MKNHEKMTCKSSNFSNRNLLLMIECFDRKFGSGYDPDKDIKVWEQYKLNDYVTVQLEENRNFDDMAYTRVYVKGKRIVECPRDGFVTEVGPEEDYKRHLFNVMYWLAKNYDTSLLNSRIAFPLLKALKNAGEKTAIAVFKDEIAKRFREGDEGVRAFLRQEGYLDYLTKEEQQLLLNHI